MERAPFEPAIEGDWFHGHRIGNMKGGIAAMITAALAAKRAPVDLKGDIVLACVVGELQGGAGTVHMLESGVRADMAIVTEPIGADTILTKHAGVMQLAIHVVGETAHISRKERGVNAIRKMAKIVEALEAHGIDGPPDPELPALPLLNVGTILGGRGREIELRGPNIVPDFCSLYVDVRFTEGMTPDSVIAGIREQIDALVEKDPEIVYEIEFPMKPERRCLREVMMPVSVPSDTPLIETLRGHVTRIRGREPHIGVKIPISYGGTDTAHLWPAGIPSCVYGPAGEASEIGQAISVRELLDCTRVYAAMIEDVCA